MEESGYLAQSWQGPSHGAHSGQVIETSHGRVISWSPVSAGVMSWSPVRAGVRSFIGRGILVAVFS